ncbi:MAG: hypothetical protein HQK91_08585 [Nitrospirae bacterium]|nr:hypothetical protein [Nitrospirota bacterium]
MERKDNNWFFRIVNVSTLYWLSSGYGERPVRAGIFLGFLIIIFSFFLESAGLKPLNCGIPKISLFNNIILTVLQNAIYYKEPDYVPVGLLGKWIILLIKTIIPLQFTLLAFAVRNKFRR